MSAFDVITVFFVFISYHVVLYCGLLRKLSPLKQKIRELESRINNHNLDLHRQTAEIVSLQGAVKRLEEQQKAKVISMKSKNPLTLL